MMPTSNELDPLRAAGAIIRLTRALDQRLRRRARADLLGMAELGVLAEINRGTTLPSAIARATFLDPARVTRVVDRLVSLELVERGVGARDRRQSPLELSECGRARLEQGRADVREIMEELLAGLDDAERDALATALGALGRVLSNVEG